MEIKTGIFAHIYHDLYNGGDYIKLKGEYITDAEKAELILSFGEKYDAIDIETHEYLEKPDGSIWILHETIRNPE